MNRWPFVTLPQLSHQSTHAAHEQNPFKRRGACEGSIRNKDTLTVTPQQKPVRGIFSPQEGEPQITTWTLWGATKKIDEEHSLGQHTAAHSPANHSSPKSPASLNVHLKIHMRRCRNALEQQRGIEIRELRFYVFYFYLFVVLDEQTEGRKKLFQQLRYMAFILYVQT